MAMDAKKRAELEAQQIDYVTRTRHIGMNAILNGPRLEYKAVRVFKHEDEFYFLAMDDGPKTMHTFRLNAVGAVTMAIDILEMAKSLFPDTLDIQTQRAPPKSEQN